jgi:hypothetical protein
MFAQANKCVVKNLILFSVWRAKEIIIFAGCGPKAVLHEINLASFVCDCSDFDIRGHPV